MSTGTGSKPTKMRAAVLRKLKTRLKIERLPIPDPCRGLPGLPQRPLPAAPVKYLERFTVGASCLESEVEGPLAFGQALAGGGLECLDLAVVVR